MRESRPGGFITLHHQFWTSPDLTGLQGEHLFVFITLLHLANWKDTYFWDGPRRIDVKRGELAHSLPKIAKEARVSSKQARTTIDNLIARGVLSVQNGTQTGTRVRVLRVVNYEKFQGVPDRGGTVPGRERAESGQSEGREPAPSEQYEPVEPREPEQIPTPSAPVLALVPESRAEKRKRLRTGADPRHAPAVARLSTIFEDITGTQYGFRGGLDARKVADLLALGTDAEIDARWKRALLHTGFPSVRSFSDLVTHWNRFGGSIPDQQINPKAMAPVGQDWSSKPW